MPPRQVIGVGLGATKMQAVLLEAGAVTADARGRTPTQGGPLAIVDAVRRVVEGLGGTRKPSLVGVATPGHVDDDHSTVRVASTLNGWVDPFDLGAALRDALDAKIVVVETNVNAGTFVEQRQGAAKGQADVLGVFVGTGVGGGLVLGGNLRRGSIGTAAQIGHVIVRPEGRACRCGGRGHLEVYAGRAAMERRARSLEARGRDTALVDLAPARRMSSSIFAKAILSGDIVAAELIDEAVTALGVAIANAGLLLDVPLVVLGGGLAERLGASFVGRVEQAARSRIFGDSPMRIVPTALGDKGGAVGAALLALEATAA